MTDVSLIRLLQSHQPAVLWVLVVISVEASECLHSLMACSDTNLLLSWSLTRVSSFIQIKSISVQQHFVVIFENSRIFC